MFLGCKTRTGKVAKQKPNTFPIDTKTAATDNPQRGGKPNQLIFYRWNLFVNFFCL